MQSRLAPVSNDILDSAPDKRRYNQKLFSIVAPRYNIATMALSFGQDAFWKRKLVACLPRMENGAIVDIACGTGDISALLCQAYSGCCVIGIDLSPHMLAVGRRQGTIKTAAVQDMAALGLRDASCEMVTGCYALRNAPDVRCTLREVRRVLKDNGTAAFLDFSRSENRFVAAVQHLLLGFWGSVWGILLHGNPAVYSYIARSLGRFPCRMELRRCMKEAGFTVIQSQQFFRGMLELLICRPMVRPHTIA
jgi:demethylmenaquinone methyltransferase / 2-methoxy-6-polyprenyl-1,4-benzoquinol methylase